jgi:hypothetical protein
MGPRFESWRGDGKESSVVSRQSLVIGRFGVVAESGNFFYWRLPVNGFCFIPGLIERHNAILILTSQEHADDMAKLSYFSHVNPDSLIAADRMDAHNYNYRRAAENISFNV